MEDRSKIEELEKEAMELRQNLWGWKGISFILIILYIIEVGGLLWADK